MKNTTILILIAVLVIIGATLAFQEVESSSNSSNSDSSEVQKITLSMKNYNYYPNTITVKTGIPVELTLDSSVFGCYRSFTIRQLGISKYSTIPEDKIRFTPTKQGTFGFSCSMGMGTGTIIVE